MTTLTVTAKGQVTLRKDLLKHLGVRPGEKITVEKLPDGRIEVRAARPTLLGPQHAFHVVEIAAAQRADSFQLPLATWAPFMFLPSHVAYWVVPPVTMPSPSCQSYKAN